MYDRTADDIVRTDPALAILPIGSIEQHGPHLPVSTDWRLASAYGEALAKATGGFLLPALPISTCREHMGKKGTVWMDPDVFYQMLLSIFGSLKEQGFRKVVTLPCHGGIFMMTPATRQVNATENPGFMVANIDMGRYIASLPEGILESSVDLHAGEAETSLMLYLSPGTVHMELAVDAVPQVPQAYLSYGSIFRASPAGVWGTPSCATAEKGRLIFDHCVREALEEMERIFSYMESKEKFGYSLY